MLSVKFRVQGDFGLLAFEMSDDIHTAQAVAASTMHPSTAKPVMT